MREILYRGKGTGDDDIYGWEYGYYVNLRDSYKKRESHRIYNGFAECDCGNFYGDWCEVDPETVGQFTGLVDKNGLKIFEGDIVKVYGGSVWTTEVLWDNIWCQYAAKNNNGVNILLNNRNFAEYEVIGNIHDNPKLLG